MRQRIYQNSDYILYHITLREGDNINIRGDVELANSGQHYAPVINRITGVTQGTIAVTIRRENSEDEHDVLEAGRHTVDALRIGDAVLTNNGAGDAVYFCLARKDGAEVSSTEFKTLGENASHTFATTGVVAVIAGSVMIEGKSYGQGTLVSLRETLSILTAGAEGASLAFLGDSHG